MSTVTTTGASVAVVEVRAPGQAPERLAVTGALVLGRGDGVHRLPDARVSRRHLLLSTVSGRLVVTDLGSSNGTRVNGTLLRGSRTVRPGDVIDVGDSRIEVVEVPGDAGADVDDRTTTRARPGLGSAAVAAGPPGDARCSGCPTARGDPSTSARSPTSDVTTWTSSWTTRRCPGGTCGSR